MASSYVSVYVHFVFATKGRQPFIRSAWREDFHAYIGGIVRGLGGRALAVGGVEDHIHLLASLKGTQSISDLVRTVKLASHAWAEARESRFAWQEGFGAFGVSFGEVRYLESYIAHQDEHHRTVSSVDELRALLVEAGIEIDERYFD